LLSVSFLRWSAACNCCRNIGHFLCGAERVKRFVYVNLRGVVRNLKQISKMSFLDPLPGKISADANGGLHVHVKNFFSLNDLL